MTRTPGLVGTIRGFSVWFERETSRVAYYKVSAGKRGGDAPTVRVGKERHFVCLTHNATDCHHARACRDVVQYGLGDHAHAA